MKPPRQRNKNPFAVLLGRKGGKVRSEAKIAAARANGIKARAVAHRNQKERLDRMEQEGLRIPRQKATQ